MPMMLVSNKHMYFRMYDLPREQSFEMFVGSLGRFMTTSTVCSGRKVEFLRCVTYRVRTKQIVPGGGET